MSKKKDKIGNIIFERNIEGAKKRIILDAHCDRIGFKVTEFFENGFVKLAAVGGIDARVLIGARVKFIESGLLGIFSSVPPHLQKSGDSDSFPKLSDLAVDTGFSLDEIKDKIKIGDTAYIYEEPITLNQNYICAPALDNAAGCAVLLDVFTSLKLKNTSLTLVLSVQEEVGCRGAKAFDEIKNADLAICVDTSFAYAPGCDKNETGELGKGAMIGHSPILSRELTRKFVEVAKASSLPYQNEVMTRSTGTNADLLSLKNGGLPTALISIPIRNMHSQSEMLCISDLENTSRLICEFIKEADLNA